ncbi:tetratricopeptide repeat-containing sensor histidine kinase [Ekhidna sp.]
MRRSFFLVFYTLIVYQIWSQSTRDQIEQAIVKKDYKVSDPIAKDLIKSELSSERALGYWALGVAELSNDPDNAISYLDQALNENPDEVLLIKVLNAQANYYDITGSTRKAVDIFLKVVDLAEDYDTLLLSGVCNNLCIAYRSLDMFDSATYYGFIGLEYANSANQVYEQKRLNNSIAIVFAIQDDLDKAEFYFNESLKLALANNDSTGITKGYVNLTQVKIYQGKLDSAKLYLSQAESYNSRNRNALDIMDMYALLAEVNSSEGLLNEAILHLELAIESLNGLDYPAEKADLYLQKSELLIQSGEFVLSQKSLDNANAFLSEMDGSSLHLKSVKLQKELFKVQDKLRSALALDEKIDSLTELRFNVEKSRAIEDIQVKYESDKKQRKIESLEQLAEISELEIQRQYLMLLGGGLVIVIILIGGYFLYRNRMLLLTQQRLLVEQKLLRSQMSPHFLFNALASIHSFILKGDKSEASQYISLFSELTRDILDHSSRDWILLNKELETLEKYIQVQKLRFPSIITEIQIDDSIESSNILFPPLLLQPFVENAFEHGFKGMKNGELNIKIGEKSNCLYISLEDDGSGLDSSQSIHESKALKIVSERLSLLYRNKETNFSVANRTDKTGVVVTITIPKEEAL